TSTIRIQTVGGFDPLVAGVYLVGSLIGALFWRLRMKRHVISTAFLFLLACATALAQQTTGNVTGRVVDEQGAGVPGATVTAKSATTGFSRTEVSDAEGVYRLTALPVGL